MDLPVSPQNIQDIACFGTRRTSRHEFDNSINQIIAAVQNFNVHGDPLILADIERNAENAIYAFNTLRQKIQQRKFPVNLEELWPYIGLPVDIVSDGIGVAVNLLEDRMIEAARIWPYASDTEHILCAVQFAAVVADSDSSSGSESGASGSDGVSGSGSGGSDGVSDSGLGSAGARSSRSGSWSVGVSSGVSSGSEGSGSNNDQEEDASSGSDNGVEYVILAQQFFRVPRGFSLDEVHDYIRMGLMDDEYADDPYLLTEMHCEIGSTRHGPLETDDQWEQVLNHEENFHKVNILFVQTTD